MGHTEGSVLMLLDNPEDGSVLIDPDLLPILERVRWGRKRKDNGQLQGLGSVFALDWTDRYVKALRPVEQSGRVNLAKWIIGVEKGKFVEHLNGDVLDCRRVNLRQVKTSGQATWRWRDQQHKEREAKWRDLEWAASQMTKPFGFSYNNRKDRD